MQQLLGLPSPFLARLLVTLAILGALGILRELVLRMALGGRAQVRAHYRWQKASGYALAIVAVLVVGPLWLDGMRSLATYLGLLTAGIAISLQSLLLNLVGFLFILWQQPFKTGDRIQIGEHCGDVIDLRLLQFSLLEVGNWVNAEQSTGRIIHVPNGRIFAQPLANYSAGFEYIWAELPVLVTFESNWEKAKRILLELVARQSGEVCNDARRQIDKASKRFLIYYSTFEPTVYTSVRPGGVLLTLRFICQPRCRRDVEHALWEGILQAFAGEPDIAFAR